LISTYPDIYEKSVHIYLTSLGEANTVVTIIIHRDVFAQEDISNNPKWASGGRDIETHEA
jgi:hypothetical protein